MRTLAPQLTRADFAALWRAAALAPPPAPHWPQLAADSDAFVRDLLAAAAAVPAVRVVALTPPPPPPTETSTTTETATTRRALLERLTSATTRVSDDELESALRCGALCARDCVADDAALQRLLDADWAAYGARFAQ